MSHAQQQDQTRTPECSIELLRHLLAEMEAGRFDNNPESLSVAHNGLITFGAEAGISPPD